MSRTKIPALLIRRFRPASRTVLPTTSSHLTMDSLSETSIISACHVLNSVHTKIADRKLSWSSQFLFVKLVSMDIEIRYVLVFFHLKLLRNNCFKGLKYSMCSAYVLLLSVLHNRPRQIYCAHAKQHELNIIIVLLIIFKFNIYKYGQCMLFIFIFQTVYFFR